tara:strand:- start:523 stop:780 length:258 start_codon:yes stop_codon:yes gene_type:complete
MTPEEAKEIIAKSDRRFKNLVRAIENYNIHIDVICHDYIPSSSEVAKSHTLTSSCNPKEIAFAYSKLSELQRKGFNNFPTKGGAL